MEYLNNLVDSLNYFMDNYSKKDKGKFSSNHRLFKEVVYNIPDQFFSILDQNKYLVKGSCGNGNWSNFPWVCIFNRNITSTATKGLYIGYLFRKDLTGFYLTLMQGITYFDKNFHSNKYSAMIYSSSVINEMINDDYFSDKTIDLRVKNKSKDKYGYGYERSTIISKFYKKNEFDEKELMNDLNRMMSIYDYLYMQFKDEGYETFISDIVEKKWIPSFSTDILDAKMKNEILKESGLEKASIKEYSYEEVNPSNYDKPRKIVKSSAIIRKTDYISKARRDTANGLLGEETVLAFEKERLNKLGRSDLAKKVKILSTTSDSYGYDIISYDIDKNGNEVPRYIEVKSTSSTDDEVIFFSENEVNISDKYKENYWVYRVIEVSSKKRKIYKINGSIKENYELIPINYKAYRKF